MSSMTGIHFANQNPTFDRASRPKNDVIIQHYFRRGLTDQIFKIIAYLETKKL